MCREGQQAAAVHHVRGLCRGIALRIEVASLRQRHVLLGAEHELAPTALAGRAVDDHGRAVAGRERKRVGVVSHLPLCAAGRRHRGQHVRKRHADHVLRRGHPRIPAGRAVVVAVADRNRADSDGAGFGRRQVHRRLAADRAQRVVGIKHRRRRAVSERPHRGSRVVPSRFDPVHVELEPDHTVRVQPHEVGVDQAVRDYRRVLFRNAKSDLDPGAQFTKCCLRHMDTVHHTGLSIVLETLRDHTGHHVSHACHGRYSFLAQLRPHSADL